MILAIAELALMGIGLWTAIKYVTQRNQGQPGAEVSANSPVAYIVVPEYCGLGVVHRPQQMQTYQQTNPCATTVGCAPAFKDCGNGFHGGI